MEVVLHHVTGRFLRELSPGSLEWYLLAATNRTLHFAVPAFLFMAGFRKTARTVTPGKVPYPMRPFWRPPFSSCRRATTPLFPPLKLVA